MGCIAVLAAWRLGCGWEREKPAQVQDDAGGPTVAAVPSDGAPERRTAIRIAYT
jgi:hypothetical protein